MDRNWVGWVGWLGSIGLVKTGPGFIVRTVETGLGR